MKYENLCMCFVILVFVFRKFRYKKSETLLPPQNIIKYRCGVVAIKIITNVFKSIHSLRPSLKSEATHNQREKALNVHATFKPALVWIFFCCFFSRLRQSRFKKPETLLYKVNTQMGAHTNSLSPQLQTYSTTRLKTATRINIHTPLRSVLRKN